jgi:probable rRNA maturation factor|tara:strand:- start:12 stop:437 length:426 start_codon:yes stop_codon:yes gene_type:complete
MITIDLHNESNIELSQESIRGLLELVLSDNNHPSAEINIIITDDNSLRLMKKEYFNQDVYTDIIAFNIDEDPFEGELYISHDRVKDNAKKFNQTFEGELKRILIHGTLHLCGFDDQSTKEKSKMTSMEEDYLEKFSGKILA